MPRPYSQKFIEGLEKDTHRIGVLLARECVKANLPAKYIARALNVSRATVHNWFRGRILRDKHEALALAFISIMKEDTRNGVLPVKSMEEARAYIEGVIGEPF